MSRVYGKKGGLRIIAGKHRGRKLERPGTGTVRPTKDRVREAVFGMISPSLEGVSVLDLFAGSGAYGLEAVSRGAEKAVFLDKNRLCLEIINKNAQNIGEASRSIISYADLTCPEAVFTSGFGVFGLIFSDPPYNKGLSKNTLIMVNQYDILLPSGLLVIEHHRSEEIPEKAGGICLFKRRDYGDIRVSIYNKNE
ncbi:MAG: 16S rRNA (guanine(966)-N(2))-methyltransferase RsmD [Candidatus Omnitrophica bacterium]|nr:16S rRNA (guanine(966)-N(2))-methyltransferase RsmD [Candidatus Omnitrophota bacterium]